MVSGHWVTADSWSAAVRRFHHIGTSLAGVGKLADPEGAPEPGGTADAGALTGAGSAAGATPKAFRASGGRGIVARSVAIAARAPAN
jgi:hypothetical protein